MITITKTAEDQINLALEDDSEPFIRISIQGGGCAGFSYAFDFAKAKEDDDIQIGKVLVDSMSMMYLDGATIDYKEDLLGSSFSIENPNASTTCGCGSSFSV
jgi:iron-sulfur cluster assembly accessory protein